MDGRWAASALGVRDRAGLGRAHRSFGGVSVRCAAVASRMAMTRSPWVSRDLWARGSGDGDGHGQVGTSRQAALSYSPARCGNVLADLLTGQRAVSAFPLGIARVTWWFGHKLGHQRGPPPSPRQTNSLLRTSSIPDAGRRPGGCPADSDLLLAEQRCLRTSGHGDARPTTAVSALGTGSLRGRRAVAILIDSRSLAKIFLSTASTQGDTRGGTLRYDCTDQRAERLR